jgi:diketogulonate reductase-like aldo/keto reductase
VIKDAELLPAQIAPDKENLMQHHPFGASGRAVAVIGQGTWNIEQGDRDEAVRAIRRGIDLGQTHIDTAEMYGSGEAETMVGEAIRDRRDAVFLVSKVLPQNASRRGVVAACERSLARLGTDRLDCYLLHWRGRHPLAETIAGFQDLVRTGRILSWGVSNFDVDDLDEARRIAGDGEIACNQVLYHLEERAIEHAVLPWCERNRVAVVGYSPFGHNAFPRPASPGGKALQAIADAHGATPRQVALAFLARRPGLFAIPKAADSRHMADNAAAGDLALGEGDIARLDAAFPLGRPGRSLPMI